MTRLGVLTSGGDAPGMNAAIRAVVRAGLAEGFEVVGIRRGFEGVFAGDVVTLDRPAIVNIVQRGGTILGTSRAPRMRTPEGLAEAVAALGAVPVLGVEAVQAVAAGASGLFVGLRDGRPVRVPYGDVGGSSPPPVPDRFGAIAELLT